MRAKTIKRTRKQGPAVTLVRKPQKPLPFLKHAPTKSYVRRQLRNLSLDQRKEIVDVVNHIKRNPSEESATREKLTDWQDVIVGRILSYIGLRLLEPENFI